MRPTEREMTRRAAQALGIELEWLSEEDMPPRRLSGMYFDPLLYSADAMELATTLNLHIEPARGELGLFDRVSVSAPTARPIRVVVLYANYDDPMQAWRRAIVTVAAAMTIERKL